MIPALPLLALGLLQAKPAKKPAAKPAAAPRSDASKAAAPTSAPDAPVAYACTMALKGNLSTKRSWSKDGKPDSPQVNTEARQDTFQVQVSGTLREVPGKDGAVDFEFEPDNGRPATGSVESTVSLVTPAGSEQRTFRGSQFQPMGTTTFHARYRGQTLYASGVAFNAIGEAEVSLNGGPAKQERRLHDLSPFQDLRKDEKDFRAPGLAFSGLSLWALRNSHGDVNIQGAITYASAKPFLSGKVEVEFRVGARKP